jgi:uncharacterized membrane protein
LSDRPIRSVGKAISWRITGSFATFLIAWAIGGNVGVAGTIAVIQAIANTLLYYLHERIWNMVGWGKTK